MILRGRLVGEFDPRTVTPQELGSAMTGGHDEEATAVNVVDAHPAAPWRAPLVAVGRRDR